MPVRTAFGYHLIKVNDKQAAMGQATVAHLYRAMPKNATAQDSARVQEEINIYARRLSEGDEFETLVKMYSDDKGSRDKGGLLPKFNSNRMVPDFIKAVSKLDEPGDISAPLQTSYGWHIIKLIERDRPGGYEDEVQDLKRKMSKDQRGRKSRDMVIERIKRENGYKEYPENLRELLDAIDTTYLAMKWDAEKVAGMKKNVVKLGGESYSQHDFAVFMEEKQRRRGTTSLEVFFYKQFKEYTEDLSIALEDSKLEDKYPEFKMLMQEYHDGILLFNLTDEKVWKKAVEDTAGLERYYAANKDKYMWDQRIEADIVMVNDPSRLSDIRSLVAEAAERGQSLHEVGLDTLDGVFVEHGLYTRSDNSLVQNIEWEAGMTESMKLTDFNEFYNGNLHDENSSVFVLVRELREPEHKTLDEARGHVTSDYQNYLEDEWIRKLKEKYSLSINENVLQDIQQ
jgi:peptidyl-prolyl cis-trans isomerase SurA